jgi:hypothetical protein
MRVYTRQAKNRQLEAPEIGNASGAQGDFPKQLGLPLSFNLPSESVKVLVAHE